MKTVSPLFARFLTPAALAAAASVLGCSGAGIDYDPPAHDPPVVADDPSDPGPSSMVSLGTPFVLEATATGQSLENIEADLVQADGARVRVATRSVSFELRSDGREAAIDRVRVVFDPRDSAGPMAISSHDPKVLTVIDSSPDYVRATAGLAWRLEPSGDEPRREASEVPVSVSLEAAAEGTHVRLTMRLESQAVFVLGDQAVSTGPWVVQLEGELQPR